MKLWEMRIQKQFSNNSYQAQVGVEEPHGTVAKVLSCEILVSEFVLQSFYYVHFQTRTFGKGKNPLISILPGYGLNNSFLQRWLWHQIFHECWYAIKHRSQTKDDWFNFGLLIFSNFEKRAKWIIFFLVSPLSLAYYSLHTLIFACAVSLSRLIDKA